LTKGEEWHNDLIWNYFETKFTIIDMKGDGKSGLHIRFENEDEAALALCLDGTKPLLKDKNPFRLERV
jgi:hypothetical protein